MKKNKNLTIIVVEDNLFYQQLIAKQLESISSTIHLFTSGEDCMKELNRCKPDLIVLDNNLGGVMTGLDTLKAIRLAEPNVQIVLFSSEFGLNTMENLSLYGVFEYVQKNDVGFKNLKDRILEMQIVGS